MVDSAGLISPPTTASLLAGVVQQAAYYSTPVGTGVYTICPPDNPSPTTPTTPAVQSEPLDLSIKSINVAGIEERDSGTESGGDNAMDLSVNKIKEENSRHNSAVQSDSEENNNKDQLDAISLYMKRQGLLAVSPELAQHSRLSNGIVAAHWHSPVVCNTDAIQRTSTPHQHSSLSPTSSPGKSMSSQLTISTTSPGSRVGHDSSFTSNESFEFPRSSSGRAFSIETIAMELSQRKRKKSWKQVSDLIYLLFAKVAF